MATFAIAGIDADASRELNQALTRGGVSTVRVRLPALGTFWLAPQDNARSYIGFSIADPAVSVTISTGDDNAPYGYTLNSANTIIEFGGSALAPLVKNVWWVTGALDATVDVTVIRL